MAPDLWCVSSTGAELLALYNRPPAPPEGHVKYYTIKVPLQVTASGDEGVKGVEANWLDHMTQHFNNGASLVDGYFHLGDMKGERAGRGGGEWSERQFVANQSDSREKRKKKMKH